MVKTQQDLFDRLDVLGIEASTVSHPPLFTVAQSQELRGLIEGGHTKNLFLKDRKDQFFLVTVEEDAAIDLKTIHERIGASGKVSFGRPEALEKLLGVQPGSVTPFGAINDAEARVRIFIDAALMDHDVINVHPLTNDATTSIAPADLVRFLQSTGHEPTILNLKAASPH